MKGGIGWTLPILGLIPDPIKFYLMFLVSRNWYKTVSNLYENTYIYIQLYIEIIGLNSSYSANAQPIWILDIPDEPNCNLWLLQLLFELNNF